MIGRTGVAARALGGGAMVDAMRDETVHYEVLALRGGRWLIERAGPAAASWRRGGGAGLLPVAAPARLTAPGSRSGVTTCCRGAIVSAGVAPRPDACEPGCRDEAGGLTHGPGGVRAGARDPSRGAGR